MRDFFIVSHKYATNKQNIEPVDPNLFTKCWHLNNAIKRLLKLSSIQAQNSVYSLSNPPSNVNTNDSEDTEGIEMTEA